MSVCTIQPFQVRYGKVFISAERGEKVKKKNDCVVESLINEFEFHKQNRFTCAGVEKKGGKKKPIYAHMDNGLKKPHKYVVFFPSFTISFPYHACNL